MGCAALNSRPPPADDHQPHGAFSTQFNPLAVPFYHLVSNLFSHIIIPYLHSSCSPSSVSSHAHEPTAAAAESVGGLRASRPVAWRQTTHSERARTSQGQTHSSRHEKRGIGTTTHVRSSCASRALVASRHSRLRVVAWQRQFLLADMGNALSAVCVPVLHWFR